MDKPVVSDRDCHYCGQRIAEGREVELWDGHVYCETCVESVSPGLSEYARNNSALEEVMPTDPAMGLRRVGVICAIILAGCLLQPHAEAVRMFGRAGYVLLSAVLVGLCFGFPLSLAVKVRPRCSIRAAQLFLASSFGRGPVRFRSNGKGRNLDSWSWSAVQSWRESTAIGCLHSLWFLVLFTVPNARRKVIVLSVMQPGWFGLMRPVRHVVCGWTPEMQQRWRALLVLGRVCRKGGGPSVLGQEVLEPS